MENNIPNDEATVNRARAIMRKIQRILCKNNPNGEAQPNAGVKNARGVNPKDVVKEMANLLGLFNDLRGVVERIGDNQTKIILEEDIDALEIWRRDIRDNNLDIVNDNIPPENRPIVPEITFLRIKGDGDNGFKDWT